MGERERRSISDFNHLNVLLDLVQFCPDSLFWLFQFNGLKWNSLNRILVSLETSLGSALSYGPFKLAGFRFAFGSINSLRKESFNELVLWNMFSKVCLKWILSYCLELWWCLVSTDLWKNLKQFSNNLWLRSWRLFSFKLLRPIIEFSCHNG